MTKEHFISFLMAVSDRGTQFVKLYPEGNAEARMNCAELHLNENNLPNYWGEPLYFYRMGYLSPVVSRDLTLSLMKTAGEEHWPLLLHDCSNATKFARDINLRAKEGGWFGQSAYGSEFSAVPYEAFLPLLEDDSFSFLEEEPLPPGYRPGDLVF